MSSDLPTDEALDMFEKEDRIDEIYKKIKHSPLILHLLQAQQAPALPYAKVVGRPGTGSYPALFHKLSKTNNLSKRQIICPNSKNLWPDTHRSNIQIKNTILTRISCPNLHYSKCCSFKISCSKWPCYRLPSSIKNKRGGCTFDRTKVELKVD